MIVVSLTPGHAWYPEFVRALRSSPLREHMWDDARSSVDEFPGASYIVAQAGGSPAAWAGYIVEGGTVRCVNNFIRRGWRDRRPHWYESVYRVRHVDVLEKLRLPAYTYLHDGPIVGLHEADGWVKDPAPNGHGVSDGGHEWWRLLWTPQ